ncbi:MAG: IS30 family transposase [Halieaceae bacterium]|jgi:IS30 family transposase
MRQSKRHLRSGDRGTINIVNGVSIHTRPKDADKRTSIGRWEGDLVTGSNNTHIATHNVLGKGVRMKTQTHLFASISPRRQVYLSPHKKP